MARGATRWTMALGLLLALLCGGVGGWAIARAEREPEVPGYVEFAATVDTVDTSEADGLRACVRPIDPTLLERFGPVCGRVLLVDGLDVAASQRVHVEWFTVVTRDDGESVEAIVLSPPRVRSR